MHRTELAHAQPMIVLAAALGAGAVVTAAALGSAPAPVVAITAMSLCTALGILAAALLRRQHHARRSAQALVDGMVVGLRAALGGEGAAPVATGDDAIDELVRAVVDHQHDAEARAIETDRLIAQWTGCVQRLAEGELSRDVAFSADDQLGTALASLQGRQREFAEAARRIAEGDLTVTIAPWNDRDLLGFALAGMVDGLRSTVGELRETAGRLQGSSGTMTGISGEVSRGMEEVAVQAGQLAAGAESQVRVLEATRGDAELASQAAGSALMLAAAGMQSVEAADGTMQSLASASSDVKAAIDSLSERSGRIVDFVGLITKIADQTNLLALNAAIEAARAGDHGRGFAVVAEEVRKLAEESQRSASQISVLVEEIQGETRRTVEVVERTVQQAANGTLVVGEARAAFDQIQAAIDDSNQRVAGILASLGEVATVASNASLSTEAVSAATEQTSASMQELDAGAATTAQLADALALVAARFELDDAAGGVTATATLRAA